MGDLTPLEGRFSRVTHSSATVFRPFHSHVLIPTPSVFPWPGSNHFVFYNCLLRIQNPTSNIRCALRAPSGQGGPKDRSVAQPRWNNPSGAAKHLPLALKRA